MNAIHVHQLKLNQHCTRNNIVIQYKYRYTALYYIQCIQIFDGRSVMPMFGPHFKVIATGFVLLALCVCVCMCMRVCVNKMNESTIKRNKGSTHLL